METTQPIFNGEQKKKYDDRGISFCVDPSKNLTGWCLGRFFTKFLYTLAVCLSERCPTFIAGASAPPV